MAENTSALYATICFVLRRPCSENAQLLSPSARAVGAAARPNAEVEPEHNIHK